jgi:hypothetical protein
MDQLCVNLENLNVDHKHETLNVQFDCHLCTALFTCIESTQCLLTNLDATIASKNFDARLDWPHTLRFAITDKNVFKFNSSDPNNIILILTL